MFFLKKKKSHTLRGHCERAPGISQWEVARGAPRPGVSSPPLPSLPTPRLSLTLSPLFQAKRIATRLLCVCLNKKYIVLLSFSPCFHVSSLILHIRAPWQGPAPLPPSWLGRGALARAGRWGRGVAAELGDRPAAGRGRGAGPAGLGRLFGRSLELCCPQATSAGQTPSGPARGSSGRRAASPGPTWP